MGKCNKTECERYNEERPKNCKLNYPQYVCNDYSSSPKPEEANADEQIKPVVETWRK